MGSKQEVKLTPGPPPPASSMVVAFTGHRPHKLPAELRAGLKEEIRKLLAELQPALVISGMALGVDTWAAEATIELGIKLVAAVPFAGQHLRWPIPDQARYSKLLRKAAEVYTLSAGGYSPGALHARNHWMVDRCNLLVAVWNMQPGGGTAACVEYARKVGREIRFISIQEKEGEA